MFVGTNPVLTTANFGNFGVASLGGLTGTIAISTGSGSGIAITTGSNTLSFTSTDTLQLVTNRGNTTNNAIVITSTAASTSTTTGALTVVGGIGTQGNIVVGGYGAGFRYMTVFTTGDNQTWTVPSGVTRFKVTMAGGGGAGGGTASTNGQVGGGGGSGGVTVQFYNVVYGQNLTLRVGGGGTGASNANGVAGGGTTSTYNAVTITSGGGTGGTATGAGGAGGTATGGTLNIPGQTGSSGGTSAATAPRIPNGGNTPLGLGWGGMLPTTVNTSVAGGVYGGGGSGAYNGATATATAGGNGAGGVAIVEY